MERWIKFLLVVWGGSLGVFTCDVPLDFVMDFALAHERLSVTIIAPHDCVGKLRPFLKHWIPTSILSLSNLDNGTKLHINEEDLYVILPDAKSQSAFTKSVTTFKQLYDKRTRSDHEFWIMDISSFAQYGGGSLEDLKLDLDDDFYVYSNNAAVRQIDIFEVYRIHRDFAVSILPYGNWTKESSTPLKINRATKWERRRNLQMAHIDIVTANSAPYIYNLTPIPGRPDRYTMEGQFADVFKTLQEVLNFTYSVRLPPDGQWGALQSDGSWSGMVGMLHREIVDIGVTDFTVTRERSEAITFAMPITQIYFSLFIKNPVGTYNFLAYMIPLHNLSWVGIAIFALTVPVFLYISVRLDGDDPNPEEFTPAKSFIFTLSALLIRGWSHSPNSISGKITFATILFAGVLFYYHWESMLVSYLATRVITLPFTNLRELLDESDFLIALNPGSSLEDAFKFSTDPAWQQAWKTRIEPYLQNYVEYPDSESITQVPLNNPSIAMYNNYFSISTYPEYTACELIAIPERYDVKPFSYGFQKDSPLVGLFNHFLHQIKEKGVLDEIFTEYEAAPQVCPDYSGQGLGMDSVFTAFLVFLGGFAACLVVFAIEFFSGIGGRKWWILESYGQVDTKLEVTDLFEKLAPWQQKLNAEKQVEK